VLAIKTYKELMKLFLRGTCNVVEFLGFEISVFWCKLVFEAPLLLSNLKTQKVSTGDHMISYAMV
jgi:hypothetical protein